MKKSISKFFRLLIFLQIFALVSVVSAQTQKSTDANLQKIEKIEEFVKSQMKTEGAVGVTIGFIKDDFTWTKGFGYADLENMVPAKVDSSYRMASVTKSMTAVAILKLVEEGKIDLDAEVQKYVPYFPKKQYPVTIRQLLGHIGGISHYKNYLAEGFFKNHKNTRESIAVFENFDLIAEPGTKFNYSSYGFNLLGAVIEGASGKFYGEYMTENIWKPFGMNATLLDDPFAIIPNRVIGYRTLNGKTQNSEFIDISSRFASGGTRSTVPDMLAFGKHLYEGKLLSAKTRSEMWTSQSTRDGRNVGYGFGFSTDSKNGRFIVGHGGSQAETKTYLLIVPNQNFAAAVAINFENSNPGKYLQKVFEIMLDEPWDNVPTSDDPEKAELLKALDAAFDSGMLYFDQFGKAKTLDKQELKQAFSYFNQTLKLPKDELKQKLLDGTQPISNEALVKMVSFMAHSLEADRKDLKKYYQSGTISLYADYIKLYKQKSKRAPEQKFEESFEQMINSFHKK